MHRRPRQVIVGAVQKPHGLGDLRLAAQERVPVRNLHCVFCVVRHVSLRAVVGCSLHELALEVQQHGRSIRFGIRDCAQPERTHNDDQPMPGLHSDSPFLLCRSYRVHPKNAASRVPRTTSRRNSSEKYSANTRACSSGVCSLRNSAICTSRRCDQLRCPLVNSNRMAGARGFMTASTTSDSVSCALSRAGATTSGSVSLSSAAATRPGPLLARVACSPEASFSMRRRICSSAARLISAATEGVSEI